MAHKRMINGNVWEDDFFLSLSIFNRLLWIGILTASADDQGRFSDNAALIRSRVFPVDDIQLSVIEEGISIFAEAGKIERYTMNGKKAIQLTKWWNHQKPRWAGKSTLPAPEGWTDRERYQSTGEGIVTTNWNSIGGYIATPDGSYTNLKVKVKVKVNEMVKVNENDEVKLGSGGNLIQPVDKTVDNFINTWNELSNKKLPETKEVIETFEKMKIAGVIKEDLIEGWNWYKTQRGYNPSSPDKILRPAQYAMKDRLKVDVGEFADFLQH